MTAAMLHHVSLVTARLDQSIAFYRDVLGFQQIERPRFASVGAWLQLDAVQIHLIANNEGTFRRNATVDTSDGHLAIRVGDFKTVVSDLQAKGFREDAGENDAKRLVLRIGGPAGYPQAYVRDPDSNIIEFNAAG